VFRIKVEASVEFQHTVRILRSVFSCRPQRWRRHPGGKRRKVA
jgi:hypothetical protein